ncbi:Ephrin type-A receptor 1 [Apostichopus japonicus]|uniref:Ephrin type-A receptor 1 n=1 Tax=Stichopus japonicus TaxID=307972 RepID=A0A2G8LKR1_STIJA|nr:Ephrin type-A receptor 1 [Apostichopus japonicus]
MSQCEEARESRVMSGSDGLQENIKLQMRNILYFASSITKGMEYISSQKFSHPLLRLKKVLLTRMTECKLYDICPTETAATKALGHMKKERQSVAWMAPETVFKRRYTKKSDIWGLAVLFWELFSLGDLPMARLANSEIEQRMKDGFTLPRPLYCPEIMYNVMKSCWSRRQSQRPTFKQIQIHINDVFKYLQQENQTSSVSENQAATYFVLEQTCSADYNM